MNVFSNNFPDFSDSSISIKELTLIFLISSLQLLIISLYLFLKSGNSSKSLSDLINNWLILIKFSKIYLELYLENFECFLYKISFALFYNKPMTNTTKLNKISLIESVDFSFFSNTSIFPFLSGINCVTNNLSKSA